MSHHLFSFVREKLPQFIQDEYDTFIAFIEGYYEFMSQTNQAGDVATRLRQLRDPNLTIDAFVDDLLNEMANGIPTAIAADKRLVIQHIQDLFAAKGTDKAFKLLFKILFNEDVVLEYPSDRLLRASNGEWTAFKQLACTVVSGNIENAPNAICVGTTSNASAAIENVISQPVAGYGNVYYLTLNEASINGTFAVETVKIFGGQANEIVLQIIPTVNSFNVVNGGINYSVGDIVNVIGSSGGDAKGIVSYVTPGKRLETACTFSQAAHTVTVTSTAYHFLSPGNKVFLEFQAGVANGSYTVVSTPTANTFTVTAVTSDTLSGLSVEVTNTTLAGRIVSVAVLLAGAAIVSPVISIVSSTGSGATITANFGSTIQWEGAFRGSRGKISDSAIVLQDNRKFQSFSYVIKSAQSIREWGNTVKNLIHPAGMYMASEVVIPLQIDNSVKTSQLFHEIKVLLTGNSGAGGLSNVNVQRVLKMWMYHDLIEPLYDWLDKWKFSFEPTTKENNGDAVYSEYNDIGFNYNGTANDGYWVLPTGTATSTNTLLLPDTGSGYEGICVTLSGNGSYVAVAAYSTGLEGSDDPSYPIVQISYNSGSWAVQETINDPVLSLTSQFGRSVSLNRLGDKCAIGSPGNDTVYVYERAGVTWTLAATLTGATGFGKVVAFAGNGTSLVVSGNNSAVIRSGALWVTSTSLTTAETTVMFGHDIATNKTASMIVVGDPSYNDGAVFTFINGVEKAILAPAVSAGARFGCSVALSQDGRILAVGADKNSGNGSVFIYKRDATDSWSLVKQYDATTVNSRYGNVVRLNGSGTAAIITAGENDLTSGTGLDVVQLVTNQYGTWDTGTMLHSSTYGFNGARRWAALSGDTVVYGGFPRVDIGIDPISWVEEVYGVVGAMPLGVASPGGGAAYISSVSIGDITTSATVLKWDVTSAAVRSANTQISTFGGYYVIGSPSAFDMPVEPYGVSAGAPTGSAIVSGEIVQPVLPVFTSIARPLQRVTFDSHVRLTA